MFFPKLKDILLELINDCFDVKRIHVSGRHGIITLVPKKVGTYGLFKTRDQLYCCVLIIS